MIQPVIKKVEGREDNEESRVYVISPRRRTENFSSRLVFQVFGNVPGPIVFGVIFDLACVHFRLGLGL